MEERVKQIVEETLKRMGIAFEEVSIIKESERMGFLIKSKESGLLIGTKGAHISALNHLIKRMASKSSGSENTPLAFYVDVNDYHSKLLEEIHNKAQILAERARSFKASVEMEPMSSYERMIIHTYFENVPDIKTESQGTGNKRRVVLRYVGD